MAVKQFTLPSLAPYAGSKDHFIVGEMTELPEFAGKVNPKWNGKTSWSKYVDHAGAVHRAKNGDIPSVEASDKFLRLVEDMLPAPTARHEVIDDVVGAVPNVPAFLAGTPLTMRRKVRRENEAAPIAIIVNMTTSAAIDSNDMAKRGAAIAALARALSSRRPVELWAGCGMDSNVPSDGKVGGSWSFWRIETAPLDLARTAFLLAHPAATRYMLYNICGHYHKSGGGWPHRGMYMRPELERATVRRAFPHIEDMIYVPSAGVGDETISDPMAWVKKNVAAHIGNDGED